MNKKLRNLICLLIIILASCSKEHLPNFYQISTSSSIGGEIDFKGGMLEEKSIITLTAISKNENYRNYVFLNWIWQLM